MIKCKLFFWFLLFFNSWYKGYPDWNHIINYRQVITLFQAKGNHWSSLEIVSTKCHLKESDSEGVSKIRCIIFHEYLSIIFLYKSEITYTKRTPWQISLIAITFPEAYIQKWIALQKRVQFPQILQYTETNSRSREDYHLIALDWKPY